MSEPLIDSPLGEKMLHYLEKHPKADLLTTYFFFLENKHHVRPVVFLREKKIFQSLETLTKKLEAEDKLWRETEITIQVGKQGVNEETTKIYICPFSGKVFGNNTHPAPQDAIYDWVANCPENQEFIDGIKVKKFFVSDDPKLIKSYINPQNTVIKKTVFSSAVSGKLFHDKESIIADFEKNQLRPMSLADVPTQNRFTIEDDFLMFIQNEIDDSKLSLFIEAMSQYDAAQRHIERWTEEAG